MKKGNKVKPLKKYKEELQNANDDYDTSLKIINKIIELYPLNEYGYSSYLSLKTNNYSKYLQEYELKDIKDMYEKAYDYSNKREKQKLKDTYDEYIFDIKEVQNLKKIKKEIISKELNNNLYEENKAVINQNIDMIKNYNKKGFRIKNIYDFINGLFYVLCLILNLIYRNYLLFLTIPFGIFGITSIFSFIDYNINKRKIIKQKKKEDNNIIDNALKEIDLLKQKIEDNNKTIEFLSEQKNISISKIPESFKDNIKNDVLNDEKKIADNIFEYYLKEDYIKFALFLENNTNLNIEDFNISISDELRGYIKKNDNKKKSKNIFMKKLNILNIISIILFLIISTITITITFKNINLFDKKSLIIAFVSGIISLLVYNINTGKYNSVYDTFRDNLLSTVFNSSLIYSIMFYIHNRVLLKKELFIQMPIMFSLIFIGFVMLVSYIKYKNLILKLRK